jgi:hypothetical protein
MFPHDLWAMGGCSILAQALCHDVGTAHASNGQRYVAQSWATPSSKCSRCDAATLRRCGRCGRCGRCDGEGFTGPAPALRGFDQGGIMKLVGWKLRAKLFAQRFWQPTSACLACMPGNLSNVWSQVHWAIALRTGLATGILAVLLSFTPVMRLYANRYGNALIVGLLTALGDAYAHPSHYGFTHAEALLTGAISGLLALAGSFLFEGGARRIRAAWSRLFG